MHIRSHLRLGPLLPDRAYIADMLYLPKMYIREDPVKKALEYWGMDNGSPRVFQLWDETPYHIVAPREFLSTEAYPQYSFPFVDLTPRIFPRSRLKLKKFTFRNKRQEEAYAAYSRAHGGILNLGCGKGKTVLTLKKATELRCPVLVIVHNKTLLTQWIEQIEDKLILPPKQKIGIIQGKRFDWKRPITVAMIHTLANRVDEGTIPEEFSRYFGAVFYDEVHHLSAPNFVKTAPLITGRRYGLTATPNRRDGNSFIYNYHIGNIFYSDIGQDLIPKVYFQQTPVEVDPNDPDALDINGEFNISKLRSYVGRMKEANNFRYKVIKEAVDKGRKIICLSHSKEQLQILSEMFPGSALVIAETEAEERIKLVQNSRIAFAIASLGFEGLDDEHLDTVFYLTPFSSSNDVQQSLGRIQRPSSADKVPVAVFFEDHKVEPFRALCFTLRKVLREMGIRHQTLSSF